MMEKQKGIRKWERKNKVLLEKIGKWRESYTCKHNCWEWKKWKYCEHLRKERARVFSNEIDEQINHLVSINSKYRGMNCLILLLPRLRPNSKICSQRGETQ